MAGLFDNFYFDPNTYGGSQGILGMLRAGGPMPTVGNDQPSPLDTAQYPAGPVGAPPSVPDYGQTRNVQIGSGPNAYMLPIFGNPPAEDPAALPPNAQPATGQFPQFAQAQEPSFLDRLSAGFQGFGAGGRTGGLFGALAGGANGLSSGVSPENQTVKALVGRGVDPQMATTIARDPALLRSVLPSLMGTSGKTDDIKEFEYAKNAGFKGGFQDWMTQKKAVSGEYGMQPIWGTDAQGRPAVMQLGKNGQAVASKLPDGFNISRDPIKIEGPTGTTILDPQTRQQVGFIPKDVAGAARQKELGEVQGQSAAKLPAALIDAEETTKKIDQLLSSKGLDSIVGPLDQYRPSWTLGDDGRNALARLEQLQGGAFLQAFNTLKGGGAITEVEGAKAERAIARMQRSQSEADFREALMDFRDALSVGIRKLRASAGETGAYPDAIANTQPSAGATGSTDLKKKYGLD